MLLLVSDVVFSNSKKKNNLLFEPKRVIIKTVWVLQSPGFISSWYQHNCTNNVDLDEISNIPFKEGICCVQCFCK